MVISLAAARIPSENGKYKAGLPRITRRWSVSPLMVVEHEVVTLERGKAGRPLSERIQEPNVSFGLFRNFSGFSEATCSGTSTFRGCPGSRDLTTNSRLRRRAAFFCLSAAGMVRKRERGLAAKRKPRPAGRLNAFLCGDRRCAIKIVGELPLTIRT